MDKRLEAVGRLLDVMDELREKCPWDRKQTFDTLRMNTIEETYELADAILEHDLNEIKKELGDLLLHVVFYSKIGSEQKAFDLADVANGICDKLIFRHKLQNPGNLRTKRSPPAGKAAGGYIVRVR